MNDSMLMQAASRRAELTREAGQSRLAARARRPRPTSRVTKAQPSAIVNDARNDTGYGTVTTEKAGSKR
jgi:hypothetical protein